MIRRELYVDEFKSEIAICDDSDSYSSDEVIPEVSILLILVNFYIIKLVWNLCADFDAKFLFDAEFLQK